MNAKVTFLTHFSQRYPKIPSFSENINACIAFDLLSVDFNKMDSMIALLPVMKLAFENLVVKETPPEL